LRGVRKIVKMTASFAMSAGPSFSPNGNTRLTLGGLHEI